MVKRPGGWAGRFDAMASSCEVLVESESAAVARRTAEACAHEAWRIERKYSRYRDDSVVHHIHAAQGSSVSVDEETADLLDFADECHRLSEGRFDITSGILRRAWLFDGSDRLPSPEAVAKLIPLIGWDKVQWNRPHLVLPAGMEIDLGGMGKEYAVDRAVIGAQRLSDAPVLVNFGGDLRASGPRPSGRAWQVGIERPGTDGTPIEEPSAVGVVELSRGALATSGDSRRFLLRDGVRYSHILEPRTGWPVADAPRSVTVAAGTSVEAGTLATFAMLHGSNAESFLEGQGVAFWCLR